MLKHLQTRDDWSEKNLAAKGFTLIELLVVIIILGILAGVAIFAINGIDDDANKNSCLNELDTVQVAVEAYRTRNNTDPTSNAQLTGSSGNLSKDPQYWVVGSGGAITRDSGTLSKVGNGANECPNPTP